MNRQEYFDELAAVESRRRRHRAGIEQRERQRFVLVVLAISFLAGMVALSMVE